MYAESGQFKESLECLRNTTLSSIAISLAHKLDLGKDEMCRLCEQLAANLKQEGTAFSNNLLFLTKHVYSMVGRLCA